jgi:mannose-6-phosphate isomerase-like protein (cupin superfamily)
LYDSGYYLVTFGLLRGVLQMKSWIAFGLAFVLTGCEEPNSGATEVYYHRLAPAELPSESYERPPVIEPDPASSEFGYVMRGKNYGFDALSIIITETHSHGGPPLHTHDVEEAHIVLGGTMDYVLGESRFRAEAPYSARVPPGVAHTFVNAGASPLNLVAVFSSDNHSTELVGPNPLVEDR